MNKFGLSQDLWASEIVPMTKRQVLRDSTKLQYFNKAKSLIEAFRQNRLTTSEVFDSPKLATYFVATAWYGDLDWGIHWSQGVMSWLPMEEYISKGLIVNSLTQSAFDVCPTQQLK